MGIFKISYKTVYNWLNRWESDGVVGLYNKPGRGRKRVIALAGNWANSLTDAVQPTWEQNRIVLPDADFGLLFSSLMYLLGA